jgi:hypothetical protein
VLGHGYVNGPGDVDDTRFHSQVVSSILAATGEGALGPWHLQGGRVGSLRRGSEGPSCYLEADHLVGRSARAALRLPQSYVSSQHAVIRWSGAAWELRDLGSRNGTFLDGLPVPGTEVVPLKLGAAIAFGDREQVWQLIDDAPPTAMVIPTNAGAPALLAGDNMLALPVPERPLATVFRGAGGAWMLERAESTAVLSHHQSFEVDGMQYRFSCPEAVSRTATADWKLEASRDLRHLRLRFTVSRDEEHIDLSASWEGTVHQLGTRGHNYLLLLLARQRLADEASGAGPSECGWVYQEQMLSWLRAPQDRLNVDVFRIRKQFAVLGLVNAADIVERRHGTRQMRIGTALLQIVAA